MRVDHEKKSDGVRVHHGVRFHDEKERWDEKKERWGESSVKKKSEEVGVVHEKKSEVVRVAHKHEQWGEI